MGADMQNYRVDGGILCLGQGAVVGLSDEQAAPRMNRMEKIGDGMYRLREVLEFKSGETIKVALDDIPKCFRGIAVSLDAPVKMKKPAKATA
jgi:hypothetical protein